jgi:chromosome partitioning protein
LPSESRTNARKIIAVVNQKGGVGKTTSVVNVGDGLRRMGRRVLLIDLDAQAHLTYSLGMVADELEHTIYDLLKGQATIEQVLIEREGLALLPSSIELSAAEIELATEVGREALLKNVLLNLTEYDMILLDCPPNLGLLTLNALMAATEVFVPLQTEYLSIKGLSKLTDMVEKVKRRVNPRIEITGIIPTQYDQRLGLHKEVLEELYRHFGETAFKTPIRRNVSLAEATSHGQSIYEYAPQSHGAQDYMSLCREIIERRG